MKLHHLFVDSFPEEMEQGIVYVSIPYATAAHLCCCGCGNEVVTKLGKKEWKLTFDGESVSLHPSIGSYNLACRSHYFITGNEVKWVPDSIETRDGNERDDQNPTVRTGASTMVSAGDPTDPSPLATLGERLTPSLDDKVAPQWWQQIWYWISGRRF